MQQPSISSGPNTSNAITNSIKLEPQPQSPPVRPQAIYINCFPSLLPLLQSQVQSFCQKYLDPCPASAVQTVLRGVSLTGEAIQRSKGIKELVGAVFYSMHTGVIRLKLKDFVKVNGLVGRVFNRKYMAFQKAAKRQREGSIRQGTDINRDGVREVNEGPLVKMEQEDDDSCKSQYSQKEQHPSHRPQDQHTTHTQSRATLHHPIQITSPKDAIQVIFDGLFPSPSFQSNRRATITKMSQRCEQLPPAVYTSINWTQSRPLRILYVVYGRLRQLGMSVGFTRYREVVEEGTGYVLRRGWATRAERVVKEMVKEEEGNGQGEE